MENNWVQVWGQAHSAFSYFYYPSCPKTYRLVIKSANLSWEYFKANQFLDKYTILNPFRHKRIEELYDSMLEHGITKVSGFQEIPKKEDISFMQRPYNWG